MEERGEDGLPKSQNAMQTRGLTPLKAAWMRALYIAHEVEGAPGRRSMGGLMVSKGWRKERHTVKRS